MAGKAFLIFFGLFWSTLTCLFLGVVFSGVMNQLRATSFWKTQGVVDSAKVTTSRGSKSTTYGVKIAYHYTVNDRRYTSDRVRFGQASSSDPWASRTVHQFAAGTHPVVYYNPANPAESVLVTGIQGEDLFMALFLTPFTLVMLAIWTALAFSFRKPTGFRGLRVLEEGSITRVRPSGWRAVGAAAIGLGGSAFASIFIVGLFAGGFHPPMAVVTVTWIVVLAIAATAGLRSWGRIRSGDRDVVLNDLARRLAAPQSDAIDYNEITAIRVVTTVQKTSKGGQSKMYEVWLRYSRGHASHDLRLQKFMGLDQDARNFAVWLGERVGVPITESTG